MKIVLNGVETYNKGAELMLYAILQEIEHKFPEAIVMLPRTNMPHGYKYIETNLKLRDLPFGSIFWSISRLHIPGILRRLKLPYMQLTDWRYLNKIDYFIDGSGFSFSDQWDHGKIMYDLWNYRLDNYDKKGTKIVFLPQAFGPIEKEWTKRIINLISDKATLIYPREKISYNYLINAGVDSKKVKTYTDFTSLVEGHIPDKYKYLSGRICIIPNLRMIDKGAVTMSKYLLLMENIIGEIRKEGYEAYLLNHEAGGDERLCYEIQKKVGDIDVITGLNALEVKGIISIAYMCITSRFHGLVSALNSCVPCLATSWSHKYEELYKDYGISGCMINLENFEDTRKKIQWLLNPAVNEEMCKRLKEVKPLIQTQTRAMWDEIWSL